MQPQQGQSQPTPLISMTSQPMQSTQMPHLPPGVQQQQSQLQPQPLQTQTQAYMPVQQQPQQSQPLAPTMRELRQPAPNSPSAAASASAPTIDLETMWNRLLPGKYGILIPMFRNDSDYILGSMGKCAPEQSTTLVPGRSCQLQHC
eukprot:4253608-Amphidinium_carterae.2